MEQHIDFELAAADLDAAATAMMPYLDRLEGLIALMDDNDGNFPSNPPTEFLISIDDLFSVHQAGERAFNRYVDIYPDLRNEWIPATRQQMAMTFTKGHRAVFAEKIAVLKHCASIVRTKAGLSTPAIEKPTQNYFGDVHVGDKYTADQVGAMGPNAHAHDMTFQQIWNQSSDNIDLSQLASELSTLLHAMRHDAFVAEHEIAIGNVSAAEKSALSGDGPKTLEYLKNAGQWALEVGEKIGVGVAVAAIKSSLGL